MKIAHDRRADNVANRGRCVGFTQVKNFFHRRAFEALRDGAFDQKRANCAQSDSRFACARSTRASRQVARDVFSSARAQDNSPRRDAMRAHRASHQSPSLLLSSSLTACGLALPPEAFITWPTNQPSAFGLALASRDLVGIVGDDLVDHLLDRADVGDLLHAALFDDRARVAAFAPDDLEQVLGDLARDRAFLDQVEHGAELRGADRRCRQCPCLPC